MDHAEIMNRCDEKAVRRGFAALTKVERVLALISMINFEIEMGGMSTFYDNSAGELAEEGVAALLEIGATKAARALRAANALFPGGRPARDREKRLNQLESLRRGDSYPFGTFEAEYGAEDPDVFSKVCTYIELHADELLTAA